MPRPLVRETRLTVRPTPLLPRRDGQFENRQYEVIGGGAGTVSAAGGWLQGGGISTGLERLWGFGVDQVRVDWPLPEGRRTRRIHDFLMM
jgi:hypothetical protein